MQCHWFIISREIFFNTLRYVLYVLSVKLSVSSISFQKHVGVDGNLRQAGEDTNLTRTLPTMENLDKSYHPFFNGWSINVVGVAMHMREQSLISRQMVLAKNRGKTRAVSFWKAWTHQPILPFQFMETVYKIAIRAATAMSRSLSHLELLLSSIQMLARRSPRCLHRSCAVYRCCYCPW